MTPPALTKDNSATIGFVVLCLFRGAIDIDELHAWVDHIYATTDSCPTYFVDLIAYDEPLTHIFRTIGFHPESRLSADERVALTGIAFLRGREQFEPEPTRDEAVAALAAHPHIASRFRETFPFIIFEYDHAA
jgi:hypothetical protein